MVVGLGCGGRSPSSLCFSEGLALSWHTGRGGDTAQWEEREDLWTNPCLDSELWVGHFTGEEYGPQADPQHDPGAAPQQRAAAFSNARHQTLSLSW